MAEPKIPSVYGTADKLVPVTFTGKESLLDKILITVGQIEHIIDHKKKKTFDNILSLVTGDEEWEEKQEKKNGKGAAIESIALAGGLIGGIGLLGWKFFSKDEEKQQESTVEKAQEMVKGQSDVEPPKTLELTDAAPVQGPKLKMIDTMPEIAQPTAQVSNYLDEAAAISGVAKAVLLAIMNQESRFKTGAQSSIGATGLFQITPVTGRELVAKYGKQLGFTFADLKDPRANTILGAMRVKEVIDGLRMFLRKAPSISDVYAGYLLGPRGAKTLLTAMQNNPNQDATEIFAKAAQHNRRIFYNRSGKPKTVKEVYATLYDKVGEQYKHYHKQVAEESTTKKGTDSASTPVTEAPVNIEPMTVAGLPSKAREETTVVPVDFKIPPKPPEPLQQQSRTEQEDDSMTMPVPSKRPDVEYNLIRGRNKRLYNIASQ